MDSNGQNTPKRAGMRRDSSGRENKDWLTYLSEAQVVVSSALGSKTFWLLFSFLRMHRLAESQLLGEESCH